MGRNLNSKYVDAALAVFQELGVKSMSTRDLVRAAQERGLVDNAKWTYHNMSRKVRESELFDTSGRGQIRLLEGGESMIEAAEVAGPGVGPIAVNPGPTLGNAVTAEGSIVVTQTDVSADTGDAGSTEDFATEDFEASA